MDAINRIKLLFLIFLVITLGSISFVIGDAECVERDCSISLSINVSSPLISFTGFVRNLTGDLIPYSSVEALNTNSSTLTLTGSYILNGNLDGRYDLKASAEGYLSQTKTNLLAVMGVPLTVNFNLARTGGTKGNILDFLTSSGINNSNVSLMLYGEMINSTLTDTNGYYEFMDLAPGYYGINATVSGYNSNLEPDNHVLGGQNTTVSMWLW